MSVRGSPPLYQSLKRQKLFGQQDFRRENFLDRAPDRRTQICDKTATSLPIPERKNLDLCLAKYSFKVIQTLFRSSRHFSDNPDTLQMDTFQKNQIIFSWYGQFSDHPHTYQIVKTRYRSFRRFLLSFLSQLQFTGRLHSSLIKRKGLCLFSPQSFHARQTFEWIKPFDANFEMDRNIAGFELPPDFKGYCYVYLFENS